MPLRKMAPVGAFGERPRYRKGFPIVIMASFECAGISFFTLIRK
jgi:hypothetical protein